MQTVTQHEESIWTMPLLQRAKTDVSLQIIKKYIFAYEINQYSENQLIY